jgi:hypothetical protein
MSTMKSDSQVHRGLTMIEYFPSPMMGQRDRNGVRGV